MLNDAAEIRRAHKLYDAACNAGDLDAWLKTLTGNVVFLPPDAPKVAGKKAVAAWVKKAFFDPFKIELKAKFSRVDVFGSQALGTGSFALELTPKSGGNKVKATGKFTDVFKKQKDGSWKFSQAMWNYDKPLA